MISRVIRLVIVVWLTVMLWAIVVSAQTPPDLGVGAALGGSTAVWIALISSFSSLAALIIAMLRENRNHRWQQAEAEAARAERREADRIAREERQAARDEARVIAERQIRETARTATALAKLTAAERAKLVAWVENLTAEQTLVLGAVIKEQRGDRSLAAVESTLAGNAAQLGQVKEIVADTHDLVEGLVATDAKDAKDAEKE